MKEPKPQTIDDIEMRPDAWERFERALKGAFRPGENAQAKPHPKPSVVKKPRQE